VQALRWGGSSNCFAASVNRNQQEQHHFHFQRTALRTCMKNPIHIVPTDSLEPDSVQIDICGIELTATNENTCNEGQGIQTQNLLLATAARSDCAQVADNEAFGGNQKRHDSVPEVSGFQAKCCLCQFPDFDLYLPLCDWIWTLGIHGFVSQHTTKSIQPTLFQALDTCYRILFLLPALAVDLLIMFLYRFPENVLSLRHEDTRRRLCTTISNNLERHPSRSIMGSIATLYIIVALSLSLAWITPKGHTGPTVIEGSCSNHTRCHTTASCNVVSPSSYTCSCPSWLVGSGFDDDPCICRSAVLRTPDFSRGICVTSVSHFDMAGLLGFIFGMTIFFMFALFAIVLSGIECSFILFSVWGILVLAAADGSFNPAVKELCGSSSFNAAVCGVGGRGRFCINNACSMCPYPDLQSWDDLAGKCINGKAGSCTARSCDSLPGSICVPKQYHFVEYHVCVESSSSIMTAPGVIALAFALIIATMS
jgi:hypothetical protein